MADSLVWGLTRDTNSFLVRRGRTSRDAEIQMSAEKGNLMNVKTAKYSGVSNSSAIDLSQGVNAKGNKCVVVSIKKAGKSKKGSDYEVKNVYNQKQLKAQLKGLRGDRATAASTRFTKLARGASNANGFTKGAKSASNRKGKVSEFTFGKLVSFRNHVRKTD